MGVNGNGEDKGRDDKEEIDSNEGSDMRIGVCI